MTTQFAIFVGEDTNSIDRLWLTDGTAGGTTPIEGVANTYTFGFNGFFTAFDGPFFTNLNMRV
jgi:hypothetical protein